MPSEEAMDASTEEPAFRYDRTAMTASDFIDARLDDPVLRSAAREAIGREDGKAASEDLELSLRSRVVNELLPEVVADGRPRALVDFFRSVVAVCYHIGYFAQKHAQQEAAKSESDASTSKSTSTSIAKRKMTPKQVPEGYKDMNVSKLPWLVLEDILEVLPLSEESLEFWDLAAEPALIADDAILQSAPFKSNLSMLRVCNKFLRRSNDASRKGAVLCILARGLGVADRSAYKPWGTVRKSGEVREDQEELFETTDEFEALHADSEPLPVTADGTKGDDLSYDLYQAFWSLQRNFGKPTLSVSDFVGRMKVVLEALESALSSPTDSKPPAEDSANMSSADSPRNSFRYLTSSRLLPLQLAHAAKVAKGLAPPSTDQVAIPVVSQFLIVANHLASTSKVVKDLVSPLQNRAWEILGQLHKEHSTLLSSILNGSEQRWRKWKRDEKGSAKSFEGPKIEASDEPKPKRPRLMDGPLGDGQEENADDMFNLVSSDDLARISKDITTCVPTLQKHLETYVEALDPEAGIEEEYMPQRDPVYSWQAMRLYRQTIPDKLHLVKPSGDYEKLTRIVYKEKFDVDIPGEMPKTPEPPDDEGDDDEDNKVEEGEEGTGEDEPAESQQTDDAASAKENTDDDVKMEDASNERDSDIKAEERSAEPNDSDGEVEEKGNAKKESDMDVDGLGSRAKSESNEKSDEADAKEEAPKEDGKKEETTTKEETNKKEESGKKEETIEEDENNKKEEKKSKKDDGDGEDDEDANVDGKDSDRDQRRRNSNPKKGRNGRNNSRGRDEPSDAKKEEPRPPLSRQNSRGNRRGRSPDVRKEQPPPKHAQERGGDRSSHDRNDRNNDRSNDRSSNDRNNDRNSNDRGRGNSHDRNDRNNDRGGGNRSNERGNDNRGGDRGSNDRSNDRGGNNNERNKDRGAASGGGRGHDRGGDQGGGPGGYAGRRDDHPRGGRGGYAGGRGGRGVPGRGGRRDERRGGRR